MRLQCNLSYHLFLLRCLLVMVLMVPFSTYAQELIPGQSYRLNGIIRQLTIDYSEDDAATLFQLVEENTGKLYDLYFSAPPQLLGRPVAVTGMAATIRALTVFNVEAVGAMDMSATSLSSGNRTILVIPISFSNAPNTCASYHSYYFGTSTPDSAFNAFKEYSRNTLMFSGKVASPVTISYPATGCDYSRWSSAAKAAVEANGETPQSYNHVVYALPTKAGCSWLGLGHMPGRETWVTGCGASRVYLHELGHNLGLHHASKGTLTTSGSEYADHSDFMGNGTPPQLNAAHREQIAWVPSDQVMNVTSPGTFRIAPLEGDPEVAASAGMPQVLKFLKGDTNEFFYIAYRRKIGLDTRLSSEYAEKVQIVRAPQTLLTEHSAGALTFHIASLEDGGALIDSANGVTITQLSHNNEFAEVTISGDLCARMQPSIVLTPAFILNGAIPSSIEVVAEVRSNDSSSCQPTTFNFSTSNTPVGMSNRTEPSSLLLAPGEQKSVRWTIEVAPTLSSGYYQNTIVAAHSSMANRSKMQSIAMILTPTNCVSAAPKLTLTPSSREGFGNETVTYSLSIQNMDSSFCGSKTFNLSNVVPFGFVSKFSSTSITLAPGATGGAVVTLQVPVSETVGVNEFSIFAQSGVGAQSQGIAKGIYRVLPRVPAAPRNIRVESGS